MKHYIRSTRKCYDTHINILDSTCDPHIDRFTLGRYVLFYSNVKLHVLIQPFFESRFVFSTQHLPLYVRDEPIEDMIINGDK